MRIRKDHFAGYVYIGSHTCCWPPGPDLIAVISWVDIDTVLQHEFVVRPQNGRNLSQATFLQSVRTDGADTPSADD